MMLSTPCGVDFVNTLLYHLKALQLSFFLFSFPTLSEGYNTGIGIRERESYDSMSNAKQTESVMYTPIAACSCREEFLASSTKTH